MPKTQDAFRLQLSFRFLILSGELSTDLMHGALLFTVRFLTIIMKVKSRQGEKKERIPSRTAIA